MYIDFLKNENLKKKTFYDIDDHQNALSQSVKMVYCQLVKFIFKTVLCLQACRDAGMPLIQMILHKNTVYFLMC